MNTDFRVRAISPLGHIDHSHLHHSAKRWAIEASMSAVLYITLDGHTIHLRAE
jgi:hypothetical protein